MGSANGIGPEAYRLSLIGIIASAVVAVATIMFASAGTALAACGAVLVAGALLAFTVTRLGAPRRAS